MLNRDESRKKVIACDPKRSATYIRKYHEFIQYRSNF